jgi:hypothetical protein
MSEPSDCRHLAHRTAALDDGEQHVGQLVDEQVAHDARTFAV